MNAHPSSERVWIWDESGEISIRPPREDYAGAGGEDGVARVVGSALLPLQTIGDGSCLLHAMSMRNGADASARTD